MSFVPSTHIYIVGDSLISVTLVSNDWASFLFFKGIIIIRDNYTFRCVRECRRIHYEFINNIDVGITVAANDSVTLLKTILTSKDHSGINLGKRIYLSTLTIFIINMVLKMISCRRLYYTKL